MASIAEILSSCGKEGERIYSLPWGYVNVANIDEDSNQIKLDCGNGSVCWLDGNGRLTSEGECLIWPSCDQRDWEAWGKERAAEATPALEIGDYVNYANMQWFVDVIECTGRIELTSVVGNKSVILYQTSRDKITKASKFEPSALQPYDRVIARFSKEADEGYRNIWSASHYSHKEDGLYFLDWYCCSHVVPYNDLTKHLIGTTDDAPDFYRL